MDEDGKVGLSKWPNLFSSRIVPWRKRYDECNDGQIDDASLFGSSSPDNERHPETSRVNLLRVISLFFMISST